MADRFGHLLFTSRGGEAVTLDLYAEEQIEGRGFFLGPEGDLSVLHEVQVAVDRASFEAVETELGLGDLSLPLENQAVQYGEHPELAISAHQPDPARKAVVGTITVRDDTLTFRGEEVGSPELITIIVVSVWALVCGGSALHDLIKPCEERAVDVCGQGGVKSVKSKRSWRKFGCSASCEIECLEGHTTREVFHDSLSPAGSPA